MATAIRLTEDGPIRYRDRHVSVGRGKGAVVDDDAAAERLLDTHEFLVAACGATQSDGSLCTRPPDACQYHGEDAPETATAPVEPADETDDDAADLGSPDPGEAGKRVPDETEE